MLSSVADTGHDSPGEAYEAIETAVMESKRGRWFLSEYARRLRSHETSAILEALRRLEAAAVPPPGSSHSAGTVRQLRSMGRELMSRSEAVRRISAGLANGESRQELADEADALRLLALSHDLMCHQLSDGAMLYERTKAQPLAVPLTSESIRFFAGDEDMFEADSAAAAHGSMPSSMQHDQVSPPVKNRIVIIRHAAGEDPAIPLQGDLVSSA